MEGDLSRAVDTYRELLSIAPNDAQAEAAVEQLYAEQGRWHDLADFYRERAAEVDDARRRHELRHRLARTLAGDLHDIEGATDVYVDLLEDAPDRTETIRSVEGLLRDLQRRGGWKAERHRLIDQLLACVDTQTDWRRRLDLLEHRRDVVDTVADRAQTLRDQAELMLEAGENEVEQLPAVDKAARAYCLGFDEESWSFLKTTTDRLDGWHRVPGAILSMLVDVPDEQDRGRLLITVGDIFGDHLDDRSSAVEAYRDALEQGARHTAMIRLEGELEQMEAWDALADTLERRLEDATDTESEGDLLARLGVLHDQQLGQPERAIDFYEELVDRDPSVREHVEALDSLYRRTGAYEALADLCERQVGMASSDQTRAEWMSRLASVQHEFLDDPDAALETYRSLREVAPDRGSTLEAMVSLLREQSRWPELLEILEERRDLVDEPADIDVDMAHVQWDHLGNPEAALDRLVGVLEEDPSQTAARREMQKLTTHPTIGEEAKEALYEVFRRHDQIDAWQTSLEERVEVLEDPGRCGDAQIELAEFHVEHGDGPRRAFGVLSNALRSMPQHARLRERLQTLAINLEFVDELTDVYEEIVRDTSTPEIEAAIRTELAELYAEHHDELGKAIRHAKAADEQQPQTPDILDLLDRLYQQSGNWNALADVLETRLEIADRGELTDVRFRLAYLHENMFEEAETAFEYYREVLQDEPDHGGAITALERMIEGEALSDASSRDAIRRLEDLYRAESDSAALVELLQIKADKIDDPIDRSETLAEIARLQQSLEAQPSAVFESFARALRADPLAEEIQDEFDELVETHELYEPGLALLEELLETLDDPIRREAVALSAGTWALDGLDAPERAVNHFRVVLDEQPDHEEALSGLEDALRATGQQEALRDVLARRIDQVHDPDDQRDLLVELSKLHRDAGDIDEAIDTAQRALTIDEGAEDILKHLIGLLDGAGRPNEYVDTLERLGELTDEDDVAADLFMQAADASQRQLDNADRAMSFAQRALDREADHPGALDTLESIYRSRDAWDEVDDLLRRKLKLAETTADATDDPDSDAVLELLVELGEVANDHRDRPQEAVDWFEQALEVNPQHHGAVQALQRLYANEGRTDDLMRVWERQLDLTDDDEHRRRVYCDMAVTSIRDLDDAEQAADYLEKAAQLGSDASDVLHARRIYHSELGEWPTVLEVLDREVDQTTDDDAWRDRMRRRAEILEDHLDRPSESLETLQHMVQRLPEDNETFKRAIELTERLGEVRTRCELYQLRADRAESPDEIVEDLQRVADLAEDELDDLELAAGALAEAHEVQPTATDITERLIDLLLDVGAAERAEPLIDELIEEYERQGETDSLVSLQHRRGKLAEARGDQQHALEIYQDIHDKDASFVPNLLSLSTLAIDLDNWELAREISEKLLLHQMSLENDAQKVQLYYNLGRVRAESGDERRASDMFNRALNIDPDHTPSEEGLEALD
jgi:tetratricopeptide (TPR) repeat protein